MRGSAKQQAHSVCRPPDVCLLLRSASRHALRRLPDLGYGTRSVPTPLAEARSNMSSEEFKTRESSEETIPDTLGLLAWGRRFLPDHFSRPPSRMHEWLEAQLAEFRTERGRKLNVLGPRGSAKSTIASLAYILRAAVEKTEPYIWLVSDTIPQAQMHLDNIKAELTENELLADHYPNACGEGRVWRAAIIILKNEVVIEALSTGQRVRGRKHRHNRPTLIVADDL